MSGFMSPLTARRGSKQTGVVGLGADPYSRISENPFWAKKDVSGRFVAVLDEAIAGRNLDLITARSRALLAGEIHEVVLVIEAGAAPGVIVPDAVYLGFFEVQEGGVVIVGDAVYWEDTRIGTLAGFDETHHPNHMNIVIATEAPRTGRDLGVEVGHTIRFRQS
jgi:hypothetical protein